MDELRQLAALKRRHVILGGASAAVLAACGGGGGSGGDPTPPPPAFGDRAVVLAQSLQLSHHTATRAGDGSVVVLGGSRGGGVLSTSVDRFNPVTRTFSHIGDMATGRSGHRAVRLQNGRILVAGGQTGTSGAPFAELVDEQTGAVEAGGAMQVPRQRHTLTLLADGRVVAIGGLNRANAEIWNPATRQWRLATGAMRHTREVHTATLLPNGRVLVAGGSSPADNYTFAEVFDPATETFTPVAGGATRRIAFHEAVAMPDGSVLLFGGESLEGQAVVYSAAVWRFDPANVRFVAERNLALPRTVMRAVLRENEVLLVGGETVPPSTRPVAWRSDGERQLAALPAERLWHTATLLADGKLLVLGGENLAGTFQPAVIYE